MFLARLFFSTPRKNRQDHRGNLFPSEPQWKEKQKESQLIALPRGCPNCKRTYTQTLEWKGQSVSRTLSALRVSYLNFLSLGQKWKKRSRCFDRRGQSGGKVHRHETVTENRQHKNVLTLMFYKLLSTHLWHKYFSCPTDRLAIFRSRNLWL